MNELSQLQNDFQNYLLHINNKIQDKIVVTEKISTETRLAIYKNAYYIRLFEALETSYPILQKYLGDDTFEEIAYGYIHQYTSHYQSIRWFGDQLPIFLNETENYQTSPYLAEIALFEWTMSLVFDAADATSITLDKIAKIPPEQWETMKFKLHPAVYCLNLNWNSAAIWQAIAENEIPPQPENSEPPSFHIFWRKNFNSYFCSVPTDEAWAINAICDGKSFGDICEGLCQWHPEENAPLHAASLLKGWISADLISEIYF